MKIFAIGDLHLSTTSDKPMDVFGGGWENHLEKIKKDWLEKVSEEDIVLIAGDGQCARRGFIYRCKRYGRQSNGNGQYVPRRASLRTCPLDYPVYGARGGQYRCP